MSLDGRTVEAALETGRRPVERTAPARAFGGGRYELQDEVGRGAMGIVFRALDRTTGSPVAVKVMLLADGADPAARRARFEREARLLRELRHASIPRVHEVGEADGLLYIVTDFLEGRTLADAAVETETEHGRLRLVAAVRDVARALHHAHGRGLVHRDVKPENIIVVEERAFLVDFGLARGFDGGRSHEQLSRSGEVLGTPAFLAPEQVAPDRFGPVGPRTDVRGLGATLYHVLAGRPPFEITNALELMVALLDRDPPSLRTHLPGAPAALVDLCRDALARRPEDRPASAEVFADRLDAYLAPEDVGGAAPAGDRRRVGRGVAIVVAIMAALTVGLLVRAAVRTGLRETAWVDGLDALGRGDHGRAAAAFERVLAIDPSHREARARLADCREELDAAAELFRWLEEEAAGEAARAARLEAVATAAERALAVGPDEGRPMLARALADGADLGALDGPDGAVRRRELLRARGRLRIEAGDRLGGLTDLDAVVAEAPEDAEAHHWIAVACLLGFDQEHGDYLARIERATAATLAHGPERADTLALRAYTVAHLDGDAAAQPLFARALEVDPDDLTARFLALVQRFREGEREGLPARFSVLLGDVGERRWVFRPWTIAARGYAELFVAAPDWSSALRDFDRALELDPTYGYVHLFRAEAFRGMKDPRRELAERRAYGRFRGTAAGDDPRVRELEEQLGEERDD